MTDTPQVKYRLATHADKEAVLAINPDLLDGLDYMPHYYTSYINHPDIYCYVTEVNGDIVGFAYAFICDDGTGMIRGGTRGKQEVSGKGFLRGMRDFIFKHHLPKLFDIPATDQRDLMQDSDFYKNQLLISPTVDGVPRDVDSLLQGVYCTPIARLQQNSKSAAFNTFSIKYPRLNLKRMRKEEIPTTLLLPINKSKLFPKNCVLVGRHPFKPQKGNFEYVAATTSVFVTEESNAVYSGVSFVEYMIAPKGLRVDMVYYGTQENLGSHILNYLEDISLHVHTEDNIFMIIIFPAHCDMGVLYTMADTFGWYPGPWKANKVHISLAIKEHTSKL